jgi:hypothetical protein
MAVDTVLISLLLFALSLFPILWFVHCGLRTKPATVITVDAL